MKTLVGFLASEFDLERVVLTLLKSGFKVEAIQWGQVQRSVSPERPRGIREWLRRGGALGDTISYSDTTSLMDGAAAGATIGALLGIVYGSRWPMGSVTAGTLGILVGGFIGWLFDHWVREQRSRHHAVTEMQTKNYLVMVSCVDDASVSKAREALREGQAVVTSVVEHIQGN